MSIFDWSWWEDDSDYTDLAPHDFTCPDCGFGVVDEHHPNCPSATEEDDFDCLG